jgi:hypothetical protein
VDPKPETDDESIPRRRANIGVAPETLKAAYPSLAGAQFAEDFADFISIGMPVLLDRVVVSDRGAARHAGLPRGVPAWSPPFTALRASENWFEPVRRLLAQYFFGEDESGVADSTTTPTAGTHTVTYLSRQNGADGERLLATDHVALLDGLQNLARTGVKVYVLDENSSWTERMRALAQSTVSLKFLWALSRRCYLPPRYKETKLIVFFPLFDRLC